MKQKAKYRLIILGIFLLTAVAGFVVYPKTLGSPDSYFGSSDRFFNAGLKLGLDLQGGAHLVYEADMSEIAEADRAEALVGVRDVIERRVNVFGVSEPLVQTSGIGDSYRIIVELAGVFDIDQAIKNIGETPRLEFRELSETEDASVVQERAQVAMQEIQDGKSFEEVAKEKSEDLGSKDADPAGDLGYFKRGVMIPEFEQAVFDDLAVGDITPEPVKTVYGFHIIKKTDEREVPAVAAEGETPPETGATEAEVRASHILFLVKQPQFIPTGLSGEQLDKAQVVVNPTTGETEVSLAFDKEGADLFAVITKRNIGKQVAIFLDGTPISQPVVNQEISSGEAVITGGFTVEQARELSRNLNAGALPVPIELINQQTVGATLGEQSIQRSFFAGIVGLVTVMFFMIVFYRLPGVIAVVALVLYAIFVLTVFQFVGVTLTLSGIAGFILSVGMAVDANVLIFERMREELRSGRSLGSAVTEGFNRAWPSIRDSNVSSLITCFILGWLGTGMVKGFAITLGLGIVVSMFTAITVTRTILLLFVKQKAMWLFGVAGNRG